MVYRIPPNRVLDEFTESELVHLVAYENLYGQLGPERLDTLFARLGMDVTAPHMRKGKKPKFEDHLIQWGGKKKRQQSPEEMLQTARQMQARFDAQERAKRRSERQRPFRV
ncbi:hypothetical protein ACFQZ2_05450 [Streptomonospora algeriensis]|uniref:Minor tail T domain-containing protein n=1 Tax=Streptomonospora algeriensis TaxID=995084 RepID=A0ABW3BAR3_9ACTN